MKTKNLTKNITFALLGLCLFVVGLVLVRYQNELPELATSIPYIFVGIGTGIFGHNLGSVLTVLSLRKDPTLAKSIEIEEKDERNVMINNTAKAKAYDLMILVYGALILLLALMEIHTPILLTAIAAYLFIVGTNIYYNLKFRKEL